MHDHSQNATLLDTNAKRSIVAYLATGGIVFLLMMVFGLLMLLNQGKVLNIGDKLFYELMTLHGAGMIGTGALAASAVMWYFVRKYINLSTKIFVANFLFFITGVVLILVGVLVFDFAGAWTFLYPLPAMGAGMWQVTGAFLFLFGLTLIGVGFLLLYLDIAKGIIKKYGGLGRALGWDVISGKKDYGPPGAVVAATMVCIVNTLAITIGAAILIMSIINLFIPSFTIDPLLAKNMTYLFGHVFANAIIYMAVVAVYEILSQYTDRPWKSNKVFLIAWNMSTFMTLLNYPHHLLMDFAYPKWFLIMGQIFSYINGLPVLVVTAFGAIMIVYRSGIRWDMASGMMFLSMFGWVAGVVPAIIDATIVINTVMHNTKWVPGHFHMYMGVGVLAMIFGFMYYLSKHEAGRQDNVLDRISFWIFSVFFMGLSFAFLYQGAIGTPRRWSTHTPEWAVYDVLAAIFTILIISVVSVFVFRFLASAKSFTANKDKETTIHA